MANRRRAFTLSELMVAVVVLLVVILATSRLFNTASTVAGLGEANSDVLQDATTIERQMRLDFERLSPEGFMVIRNVEVPNDINVSSGGGFLNPALPADGTLRCDQLFFFIQGTQQMVTFGTLGSNIKGMGTGARVYYGHSVSSPVNLPVDGQPGDSTVEAHDPRVDFDNPLTPWHVGPYPFVRTVFDNNPNPNGNSQDYNFSADGNVVCTQPPAPQWSLARQAVVLADDGGNPAIYLNQNRTAFSIDHAPIFQGRVDGAAQEMIDLRRLITTDMNGNWRNWLLAGNNFDQRDAIALLTGRSTNFHIPYYPRAEREAPSMHRVDQGLTNHIIGTWCSSFKVDWTYAPGTGEVLDENRNFAWAPGPDGDPDTSGDNIELRGLIVNADPTPAANPAFREHPWFGMLDAPRGVYPYRHPVDVGQNNWRWWQPAPTIDPINVEEINLEPNNSPVRVYEAIFGYNQTRALEFDGNPDFVDGTGDLGYTPWPTALRVTMTLHDSSSRLTEGREVQFVIHIPQRR